MKVLTIFGTRPEAIKMAPVLKELAKHKEIVSRVCVTAQHREMLDMMLQVFEITPEYDLDLMKPNQSLFDITARGLPRLEVVLDHEKPDIVLVQGDATTAFLASLAAFYKQIKIGHVEAGLRSHHLYQPFPEEMNRRLVDHLADLHFAPTETAKNNLLREGIDASKIYVTGNTVIDALYWILQRSPATAFKLPPGQRLILVTVHRRESFGPAIESICRALKRIAEENKDVEIIWPVHLNPKVRQPVRKILKGVKRVQLLDPLDYSSFVQLMSRSYLILSDSGGIQEEAPALGKPVVVLRDRTDRPEAVAAGVAVLAGTDTSSIVKITQGLLNDSCKYKKIAQVKHIYGDGQASQRIVKILQETLT